MRDIASTARQCIPLVFIAAILLTACNTQVGRTPIQITRNAEVKPMAAAVLQKSVELPTSTVSRPAAIPSVTPTSLPTPTSRPTQTPAPTLAPTAAAQAEPAKSAAASPAQPASASATGDVSSPGITRLEDTDPAPPLSIQVDTLRVEDGKYKVTGVVRNDGSETYEGVGVLGTFYVSGPQGEGMAFPAFPPGKGAPPPTPEKIANPDKKVLWAHGPIQARCPCPFLEPGAECPFSLEIYARDYAFYRLHPTGQPAAMHTWHESASVTVDGLTVSNDGLGNVRITGKVINKNDYALKSATVAGTLQSAEGQVVSEGSAIVLGIGPGASASFDLRIKYEPYARYDLYIQGVRY